MNLYKKILLADDHSVSRYGLEMLIVDNFPHFEVKHASNFSEILKHLHESKFDLIVLDAIFPEGNVFNILPAILEIQKEVNIIIFSALDESFFTSILSHTGISGYVSKLANEDELLQAIDLIFKHEAPLTIVHKSTKEKQNEPSIRTNSTHNITEKEYEIMNLMWKGLGTKELMDVFKPNPKRISLSTYNEVIVIDLKNIVRCETSDSYTTFFFSDGKNTMVSKPLKHYDNVLTQDMFYRVHQSHKVNILYIKKFIKSGKIILSDGTLVPVSQRNKEHFLKWYVSFQDISLTDYD